VNHSWTLAKKELRGYFGSAVAIIFLAAFLAFTLFTFFWVEKFFARGVADLRPMFDWLPLLLIFLVAALSMRLWSEERKAGTIEVLLTLPVPRTRLVLGKFLAGMLLIALALALTFGLPLTISTMGDLDWGPVVGGYVAALLLAAAYLSIGMCVSAATDNQIVALIATFGVCALTYVPGTSWVADLVGSGAGDVLRRLGMGSRFASVARGVLDLRDLVYYGSVVAVFLGLNVVLLGMRGWSWGPRAAPRRRNAAGAVALAAANAVLLNLWLTPSTASTACRRRPRRSSPGWMSRCSSAATSPPRPTPSWRRWCRGSAISSMNIASSAAASSASSSSIRARTRPRSARPRSASTSSRSRCASPAASKNR
jgi:ABC-2 type transport system permease protein